jgi:hypothetical protein
MTILKWRTSLIAVAVLIAGGAAAQDRFELVVPSTDVVSTAERTAGTLRITDATGAVTIYRRNPQYDSGDGTDMAYASRDAGQVIRWPADNRGAMHIGTPDASGGWTFRESRMRIRPLATDQFSTAIDPDVYYRVISEAAGAADLCLAVDRSGSAIVQTAADAVTQQWRLVEAGAGYFRLQCPGHVQRQVLGIAPGSFQPRLQRAANDVGQLWQIAPVEHRPGCFRLTSAADDLRGRCLAVDRRGSVTLARYGWREDQYWTFRRLAPIPAPLLASQRTASRQIAPNPPLPTARVELVNSHSKELWILIADLANPAQPLRLKIPPGQSQTVSLARDPGATLVEVYESVSPYGSVRRDELVTQLPPAVLYDVSVYEVILQSISIDRTVPGGRLDRTNYSPKSVGLFPVPPGAALQDGRLDVYEMARQQENPGAVRRIDPEAWSDEPQPEHPVDSLLRQFQPEELPAPKR